MPLIGGSSQRAIGTNIRAEIGAGRPRNQAIAIAMSQARRAKRKMAEGGLVEDRGLNDVGGSLREDDELFNIEHDPLEMSHGDGVASYDPAAPQADKSYDNLGETTGDPSGPRDALVEEPHGDLFVDSDFFGLEHDGDDEEEGGGTPRHPLAEALRKRRMARGGGY